MIKNNNDFLDGAIFWLVGWFEILRQKFFAIGGGSLRGHVAKPKIKTLIIEPILKEK